MEVNMDESVTADFFDKFMKNGETENKSERLRKAEEKVEEFETLIQKLINEIKQHKSEKETLEKKLTYACQAAKATIEKKTKEISRLKERLCKYESVEEKSPDSHRASPQEKPSTLSTSTTLNSSLPRETSQPSAILNSVPRENSSQSSATNNIDNHSQGRSSPSVDLFQNLPLLQQIMGSIPKPPENISKPTENNFISKPVDNILDSISKPAKDLSRSTSTPKPVGSDPAPVPKPMQDMFFISKPTEKSKTEESEQTETKSSKKRQLDDTPHTNASHKKQKLDEKRVSSAKETRKLKPSEKRNSLNDVQRLCAYMDVHARKQEEEAKARGIRHNLNERRTSNTSRSGGSSTKRHEASIQERKTDAVEKTSRKEEAKRDGVMKDARHRIEENRKSRSSRLTAESPDLHRSRSSPRGQESHQNSRRSSRSTNGTSHTRSPSRAKIEPDKGTRSESSTSRSSFRIPKKGRELNGENKKEDEGSSGASQSVKQQDTTRSRTKDRGREERKSAEKKTRNESNESDLDLNDDLYGDLDIPVKTKKRPKSRDLDLSELVKSGIEVDAALFEGVLDASDLDKLKGKCGESDDGGKLRKEIRKKPTNSVHRNVRDECDAMLRDISLCSVVTELPDTPLKPIDYSKQKKVTNGDCNDISDVVDEPERMEEEDERTEGEIGENEEEIEESESESEEVDVLNLTCSSKCSTPPRNTEHLDLFAPDEDSMFNSKKTDSGKKGENIKTCFSRDDFMDKRSQEEKIPEFREDGELSDGEIEASPKKKRTVHKPAPRDSSRTSRPTLKENRESHRTNQRRHDTSRDRWDSKGQRSSRHEERLDRNRRSSDSRSSRNEGRNRRR